MKWLIFENCVPEKGTGEGFNWFSIASLDRRTQIPSRTQPPLIETREEFDRFIQDLHETADRIWPIA